MIIDLHPINLIINLFSKCLIRLNLHYTESYKKRLRKMYKPCV